MLADRLQALDDLSEDAIRAKMEARALMVTVWVRSGCSNSGACGYDELGAQPSALIDGMAIWLRRRGWEQTGGSLAPGLH